MQALARGVIKHRWWVIAAWLLLGVAGGYAAPRATAALSYDFSLPGSPAHQANQKITAATGPCCDNAPVLLVLGNGRRPVPQQAAGRVRTVVQNALIVTR